MQDGVSRMLEKLGRANRTQAGLLAHDASLARRPGRGLTACGQPAERRQLPGGISCRAA
jgi:hypothetical protein